MEGDLHRCVTGIYYHSFYHLELYLNRINDSVRTFADSWNHHGLRTAHSSSPLQLYTSGFLGMQNAEGCVLDLNDNVQEDYGFSEEGMPTDQDDREVVIPEATLQSFVRG